MMVLRDLILGFTENTFFEHFVAGRDVEEAGATVKMLWEEGLRGMLDYGLEHANDNESCDRNMDAFINTVDFTTSLPTSSVSFFNLYSVFVCSVSWCVIINLFEEILNNVSFDFCMDVCVG